jgi:ketosteroid isomerase-like protein
MSNLDKIQAFFAAYARKDVSAVKSVMADDIILENSRASSSCRAEARHQGGDGVF